MSEAVLYDTVGPRGRRRILLGSVAGVLLVVAVLGVAVARLAAKGSLDPELWRVLTEGAVLAVGRLSRRAWVARPAGAWVELFRGLPLLLMILFLFLGLPAVGITISVFWALVAGLTSTTAPSSGRSSGPGSCRCPRARPRPPTPSACAAARRCG